MEIKIQIKSILGDVLFEFSKEDNTVKETLERAVQRGAYLEGAYLEGAYLGGADLRGADLEGAYLEGAGKISSVDDILIVGPMGSRAGYVQAYHTDKGIFVKCGCFYGTIAQFRAKVKETHGDNRHAQDYALLADFIEARFNAK